MAGLIKNIMETLFTTSGASSVTKATNQVTAGLNKTSQASDGLNKSTTRQGQASVNASRAFAAQSKGLGGLVAAYAGAAATTFALGAAFDALSKAAQAENIVKGTNTLAAAYGISGPKILQSIREITQGQLSLADSARSVNLALSAGFNTSQIENFTIVALKASRALGRDFSDSYDRIIKGASKLEPELLDELGIMTRLIPAQKAYAKQLGVSVTALNQFDKTQAFANAIIEEGLRKFSDIDISAPSTQKTFAQLQATISDLTTAFTTLVAKGLVPMVKFFTNDAGNTFALFGLLLTLVFKKAKEVVSDFSSSSLNSFTKWADSWVESTEKVKAANLGLELSSTQLAVSIEKRNGLRGGTKGGPTLPGGLLAGTGNFNQAGVNGLAFNGEKLATEAAAVRKRFLNNQVTSINVMKQEIATLELVKQKIESVNGALAKQNVAYMDATVMIAAYNKAQATAGKTANIVAGGLTLMSKGLKGIGLVASTMLSAFNWIFIVTTALEFLGFDVIGKVIAYFKDMKTSAEQFSLGLRGAFTFANTGIVAFEKELRIAGATAADLENVSTRISEIREEIIGLARDAKRVTVSKALQSGQVIRTPVQTTGRGGVMYKETVLSAQQMADNSVKELEKVQKDFQNRVLELQISGTAMYDEMGNPAGMQPLDQATAESIANSEFASRLKIAIDNANKKWTDVKTGSINQLDLVSATTVELKRVQDEIVKQQNSKKGVDANLKLNEVYLKNYLETLKKVDIGIYTLAGSISMASGVDISKIYQLFAPGAISDITGSTKTLDLFGVTLQRLNGYFDFNNLKTYQQGWVTGFAAIKSSLTDLNDEFNNGTVTVQSMSSKIGSLQSAMTDLRFSMKGASGSELQEMIKNYMGLNLQFTELVKKKNVLQELEKVLAGITSAYSKQIGLKDSLIFSGEASVGLNAAGQQSLVLATNENEVLQNRFAILTSTLAKYQSSYVAAQNLSVVSADIAKEAEIYETTLNAINGILLEGLQLSVKIQAEQEGITKKAKEELKVLEAQLAIDRLRDTFALNQLKREGAVSNAQADLDFSTAQLDVEKKKVDILREQADAVLTLLQNKKAGGDASIVDARLADIGTESSNIASSMKTGEGREAATALETALKNGIREGVDHLKNTEMDIIAAKKDADNAFIRAEMRLFDAETQLIVSKIRNEKANLAEQYMLQSAQIKADSAKIDAEKAIIQAEASLIQAQLRGYQSFAMGVNAFASASAQLAEVFRGFLAGLPGFVGANPGAVGTVTVQPVEVQVMAATNAALAALGTATSAQIDVLSAQQAALVQQQESAANTLNEKYRQLTAQEEAQLRLRGEMREGLLVNLESNTITAENAIADLGSTLEDTGGGADKANDALEKFRDRLLAIYDLVQGSLKDAFMGINDLVVYGEGSIKEILGNFFKTLQKGVFEQTIANPIADFFTSKLMGNTRTGIENAKVENGALVVKVANWAMGLAHAGDPTNGILDSKNPTEGGVAATGGIFSQITDFFTNLFGPSGFISNLFKGLFGKGGILSMIFGGLFGGGLGAAGGGAIHMAGGGGVNNLRDRVPAMLEPGEFVLRKQAVKKLGMPTLATMNSHGVAGGTPEVTVNMINQGTPQQATASTPRFDGEKYIIDIVTRDLANNGPIRRSIRGGSI